MLATHAETFFRTADSRVDFPAPTDPDNITTFCSDSTILSVIAVLRMLFLSNRNGVKRACISFGDFTTQPFFYSSRRTAISYDIQWHSTSLRQDQGVIATSELMVARYALITGFTPKFWPGALGGTTQHRSFFRNSLWIFN